MWRRTKELNRRGQHKSSAYTRLMLLCIRDSASVYTHTNQAGRLLRRVFILQRLKRAVIPTAAAEPNRLTRSKRLLRDSGYGMISFSVTDHMSSLNILSSSSLLCMLPDSSLKCFDKTPYTPSSSSGSAASTSIVSSDVTATTLPTQPSHVIEYGWWRSHVAITISPIRNIHITHQTHRGTEHPSQNCTGYSIYTPHP